MDSIDYFDKRKKTKKENDEFLNEWSSLKKTKIALGEKIKKPRVNDNESIDEKRVSDSWGFMPSLDVWYFGSSMKMIVETLR